MADRKSHFFDNIVRLQNNKNQQMNEDRIEWFFRSQNNPKREYEFICNSTSGFFSYKDQDGSRHFISFQKGEGDCMTSRKQIFRIVTIQVIDECDKDTVITGIRAILEEDDNITKIIVFTGHAEEHTGDWVLQGDAKFSLEDLQQLLSALSKPPIANFILNCCYSYVWREKWSGSSPVASHTTYLVYDKHFEPFEQFQSIKDFSDSGCDQLWRNTTYPEFKITGTSGTGDPQLMVNGELIYKILTLKHETAEHLKIICNNFQEKVKALSSLDDELSRKPYEKVKCLEVEKDLTFRLDSLFQFVIYPARDGDCFMLHMKENNQDKYILCDGGREKHFEEYCWKSTLSKLPHINLVISSHYDADHTEGLRVLFRSESKLPKSRIEKLWITTDREKDQQHIQRPYQHAYDLKGAAESLGIPIAQPVRGVKLKWPENGDTILIHVINPSSELEKLHIADFLKQKYQNQASICWLVEYKVDDQRTIRGLMTGDAKSNDILEGLEELGYIKKDHPVLELDFIHAPHHGSFHRFEPQPSNNGAKTPQHNSDLKFWEQIKSKYYIFTGNCDDRPHKRVLNHVLDAYKAQKRSDSVQIVCPYTTSGSESAKTRIEQEQDSFKGITITQGDGEKIYCLKYEDHDSGLKLTPMT